MAMLPGDSGPCPLCQPAKVSERAVSERPWKLMWGLATSKPSVYLRAIVTAASLASAPEPRKRLFLERGRQQRAQAFGENDFLIVEEAAVRVNQLIAAFLDGVRDGGMVVSEGGAHLARVEIEVLLAVHVLDGGTLAAHEDGARENRLVHPPAKAVFFC